MENDNSNQEPKSIFDIWESVKSEEFSTLPEEPEESIEDSLILDDESGENYMKVVLAGDGAVGKTSLRRRFLGEEFSYEYQQTIGADFALHRDQIGSYFVKFVIWDLAGQLLFHQVRKTFYKGAHGALVVCDLTNPTSFENLKHWINELWKYNDLGPVPFVIVGNKCDLRDLGFAKVSDKKIHSVAKIISRQTLRENGFSVKSMITSAKTGEGVKQAFKLLAIQTLAHKRFKIKSNLKPD